MAQFHLLYLSGMPILKQLQLEEALLRCDQRNWLLINRGTHPTIIMGISGKYFQQVNHNRMTLEPIPVIRRFSGGGTVVVDEGTLFYTLIGNRAELDFPCYPDKLLQWTASLYAPAFYGLSFALRENDYAISQHKFGGNAQYLSKNRWLHHSSLLWDFNSATMNYLLMPERMPSYRKLRSHEDFLCRLSGFFSTPKILQEKLIASVAQKFALKEIACEHVEDVLHQPHRKSTVLLSQLDST